MRREETGETLPPASMIVGEGVKALRSSSPMKPDVRRECPGLSDRTRGGRAAAGCGGT